MEELIAQTKAELARVNGELAAREHAIRAPLRAEQARVEGLKAQLAAATRETNDVKLASNRVRPRGPFMTRTGSILRVGAALLAINCAIHLLTGTFWASAVAAIFLAIALFRTPE